jgi:hypothetical protein
MSISKCTYLPAALLWMLLAPSMLIAGEGTDITLFWYLAKGVQPPVGAKLLDYSEPAFEVDFTLPADCSKLHSYYDQYGLNTDMTRIRRIDWALGYCKKQELLAAEEKPVQYNYVSTIDFLSLSLDSVPYNVHCEGMGGDEWFTFCDQVEKEDQSLCYGGPCNFPLSISRFIIDPPQGITPPESDSSWQVYQGFKAIDKSCRLHDGKFLGKITVSETGTVVCNRDPEGDGIRVSVVGFRDMNQDSYMDVVLQACQESYYSHAMGCHEFAITKKSENGCLEWVQITASQENLE